MTTNSIQITNKNKNFHFQNKNLVKKIFNIILNIPSIKEKSVIFKYNFKKLAFSLVFCDDDEIHQINKEYRFKDCPTDVITFALFVDDDNHFIFNNEIDLGEIFISYDTAYRQAQNGIDTEINTLICHGILHLLGFDHKTNEDYNFIVSIQNEVIEALSKC